MPSIDDYDKNDDSSGGADDGYTPGQAAVIGSATGGPKQATPEKQQQEDFVPWSSFVNANQDVSNREAGKLAGKVQGDVTRAQGDLSAAQSGFDSGVASNYGTTPAARSTPAPKKPPAAGAGANQNTPQAGPAYDTGLQQAPTSAAAQRAPMSNTPAGPSGQRIALNGGNSKLGGTTPQQRQPVAQASATQPQATTIPAAQRAAAGAAAAQATPAAPAPTVAALTPPQTPGAQTMLGAARARNLGANAAANGAQGPQDLEHAAGETAWNSLVSDTNKAGKEANALGSEAGVQGLLQQNQSSPGNSAFDAALLNGAGGSQFRGLANKYGNGQLEQNAINAEKGSQSAWSQLQGDVAERQVFDKAGQAAGGSAGQLAPADMTAKSAAPDPTNPSSSSYWDATADNGNTNLQNLRTDNAAGYNAVSGELGFDDGGAGRVDGHDWVSNVLQNLPANPAPGSYQANIKQAVDGAEQGLGISQQDLYADLTKMNNSELSDFWALGIIPQWMNVSGGYGKGIVGGWQSPYIQPTIAYGNDGGMWSAVENMWKTGATDVGGAIPFVGPLIKAGLDQVKVGDSRKDKFPT